MAAKSEEIALDKAPLIGRWGRILKARVNTPSKRENICKHECPLPVRRTRYEQRVWRAKRKRPYRLSMARAEREYAHIQDPIERAQKIRAAQHKCFERHCGAYVHSDPQNCSICRHSQRK